MNTSDWIQIATTIAMFGIGAIALFQKQFVSKFYSPKIDIAQNFDGIRCKKTQLMLRKNHAVSPSFYKSTDYVPQSNSVWDRLDEAIDIFYVTIKVENKGKVEARNVEVYAIELSECLNGKFITVGNFNPDNLLWSFERTQACDRLAPNLFRYCDLGHIIDPTRRQELEHENVNDFPTNKTFFH